MLKLKKLKNRKGFTLIELIVVIVILGILIAVLMPTIGNIRQRADETAFNMARKRLYESAVMFTLDFPNTEAVWASHEGGTKAIKDKEITKENLFEAWSLYLDEYPTNPVDGDIDFTVHIRKNGDIEIFPETP